MKPLLIIMVATLAFAVVNPALAQPRGGGMGPGGGKGPMGPLMYNPQTVTTVKGQVEGIENVAPMGRAGGRGQGVMHVAAVLKTSQGSLTVHLGPTWYLEQEKVVPKAGDTLEVTGSKVTLNQKPAIIASDIRLNGKSLKLRDEQGLPLWRGMGRGGGPRR